MMAWTYIPSAMTDKDRVRLRIGDTDSTAPLLQDEEIDDLLTSSTLPVAAAKAARAGAASLARSVTQSISGTVGSGSSNRNSRFDHLIQLAEALEKEAGGVGALVPAVAGFVGGISEAAKTTQEDDTDRVVPAFTRKLFAHAEK